MKASKTKACFKPVFDNLKPVIHKSQC